MRISPSWFEGRSSRRIRAGWVGSIRVSDATCKLLIYRRVAGVRLPEVLRVFGEKSSKRVHGGPPVLKFRSPSARLPAEETRSGVRKSRNPKRLERLR